MVSLWAFGLSFVFPFCVLIFSLDYIFLVCFYFVFVVHFCVFHGFIVKWSGMHIRRSRRLTNSHGTYKLISEYRYCSSCAIYYCIWSFTKTYQPPLHILIPHHPYAIIPTSPALNFVTPIFIVFPSWSIVNIDNNNTALRTSGCCNHENHVEIWMTRIFLAHCENIYKFWRVTYSSTGDSTNNLLIKICLKSSLLCCALRQPGSTHRPYLRIQHYVLYYCIYNNQR